MEKRKSPSFPWIYVIALLLALTILGIGIYRISGPRADWSMFATGSLSLVIVLSVSALGLTTRGGKLGAVELESRFEMISERFEQISILLNLISEQQLLSDRAKSVAFREKDREALRRAIQEELNKGEWDAAFRLADDMDNEFGYKQEAARFRDEIRARRNEQLRKQIHGAVDVIDRFTRSEQWNAALREAERLIGVYPDNEQVRNLPSDIERRRQEHKKRLLDSWHEAAARHDVDGSIEILKQLDAYLTPQEAEGMQETARQVFKEKLNNLTKEFANAVKDHRWADAVRTGENISREFPNTRIAAEVREKMAALKQRVNEPAVASTPAGAASA